MLPTFWCIIRIWKEKWKVAWITREEDEIWELLLYRQQWHDDIWTTYLMSREVLLHDRTVEILWHPFTHSDILEALGEDDYAMSWNWTILTLADVTDDVPRTYYVETDIKLPRDLHDLDKPEYEETAKHIISLLS